MRSKFVLVSKARFLIEDDEETVKVQFVLFCNGPASLSFSRVRKRTNMIWARQVQADRSSPN